MKVVRHVVSAALLGALASGCPATEPPTDAGADAGLDAHIAADVGADAPVDVGLDAFVVIDVGLDAPPEDTPTFPDACPPPTSLCGDVCADLDADPDHCGACDHPCIPLAGSIPFCASHRCINAVCRPGFGNCDGDRTNGCEEDTDRSLLHCGRCDHPCEAALHASPACELGACALHCDSGWTDCDPSTAGCECAM